MLHRSSLVSATSDNPVPATKLDQAYMYIGHRGHDRGGWAGTLNSRQRDLHHAHRCASNLPQRCKQSAESHTICPMYLPLGIIRMRIDKIQNGPFAHLGPRNLSSRSPKSLSTKLRTPATRHADLCKYLSPAALP